MTAQKQRFTIRASASRLDKGLLAIPQRFRGWFPQQRGQIRVVFDDEERPKELTFHPYDPVTKETRIFGVRNWFSKRNITEGDAISITLEDPASRLYRIALDRYVLERQEHAARQKLHTATSDSDAERELRTLSRLTRRRPRELAEEELLRVAQGSARQSRPRVAPSGTQRHEGVPAGMRVLLREVYAGKCQLCSFTFEKRNGEPYFEIHHLDPEVGHHPSNLLVICANCHAQMEHATVTDFKWLGGWLVGVTINGKRVPVRQPLAHDPVRRALLGVVFVLAAARMRRFLVR